VFIRVEVGRLCCEQRGRRPAEFRILSFMAGGLVPQEGGGLGQARTAGSAYTEANSSQLVAYSVLDMRHQSFNPLMTDLF